MGKPITFETVQIHVERLNNAAGCWLKQFAKFHGRGEISPPRDHIPV
jgi:hypothetical protein